jgi:hypothetical protein
VLVLVQGALKTMAKITVGIQAVLKKEGAKDINLIVHRYYVEQPSPCVVVQDAERSGIGGHIETIEEILEDEVRKHPGYTIQRSASVELETAERE